MNTTHKQTSLWNNSLLLGGLLLLSIGSKEARAQEVQDSSTATEGTSTAVVVRTPSVGVTLGTTGIGVQGILPLNNSNFALRGGVSFIPSFNYTRTDKIGTTTLEQKFKTSFVNIHVLADYYLPVLQKTGFRVSGGFAWFVHVKSKVRSVPVGDYYYGEIPINDERMGEISTVVKRNGIAPYLGAGFLNLYNGNRFHLSLDVGTYYLFPEANVKMEATGYLTGNERNQEQLKENLKGYRWLPVAQVGFYYKF